MYVSSYGRKYKDIVGVNVDTASVLLFRVYKERRTGIPTNTPVVSCISTQGGMCLCNVELISLQPLNL